MKDLKIVALPLDIVWADVDENLYSVEKILPEVDKDTDILVLPELFSTGFIATRDSLYQLAENFADSKTLKKLRLWAAKFNFAICGSLLVKKGDEFFNRGFFIEPSGEETFYDKKHLFGQSTEASNFTAGKMPVPVVRFRGWNVAMAICYDLRFPVWLRNVDNRYDVMLLPANWPVKRDYAWKQLLIARAIENQSFVVGANRSGKDDGGEYDGLTYIFDYLGRPIGEVRDRGLVYAVCDHEKLNAFRDNFPVYKDADKFSFD